jgi:hypothetical protein
MTASGKARLRASAMYTLKRAMAGLVSSANASHGRQAIAAATTPACFSRPRRVRPARSNLSASFLSGRISNLLCWHLFNHAAAISRQWRRLTLDLLLN